MRHDDDVFFFKQRTAYEMLRSLVGSEMCIGDRIWPLHLERSDWASIPVDRIPFKFLAKSMGFESGKGRAHETPEHLVCRLLLEKKKKNTHHLLLRLLLPTITYYISYAFFFLTPTRLY